MASFPFLGLFGRTAPLFRPMLFPSIPFIFLITFICALGCGCILTPPFQTPDEYHHFLRGIQISNGGLIAKDNGTQGGGMIQSNAVQAIHLFNKIPFHPHSKADVPTLRRFMKIPWNQTLIWADFGNTARYGPVFYGPSASAIYLTRMLHFTIIGSYYVARLVNAFFYSIIGFITLRFCTRGKLYLFLLLSSPMSFSLAMSASQDGLLIAVSAFLAALLSRLELCHLQRYRDWLMLGVGFGIVGMSKPPYAVLAILPCLLSDRKNFKASLISPAIAASLTLAWIAFGMTRSFVANSQVPGVSEDAQWEFILYHPIHFLNIVYLTFRFGSGTFLREIIGILGWLDTKLPTYYYIFASSALCCVMFHGLFTGLRQAFKTNGALFLLRPLGALFVFSVSMGGILLFLYTDWTKVGAPIINGIQGRYIIPILMFLAPWMNKEKSGEVIQTRKFVLNFKFLFCFTWAFGSVFTFYFAILYRYWLS